MGIFCFTSCAFALIMAVALIGFRQKILQNVGNCFDNNDDVRT